MEILTWTDTNHFFFGLRYFSGKQTKTTTSFDSPAQVFLAQCRSRKTPENGIILKTPENGSKNSKIMQILFMKTHSAKYRYVNYQK